MEEPNCDLINHGDVLVSMSVTPFTSDAIPKDVQVKCGGCILDIKNNFGRDASKDFIQSSEGDLMTIPKHSETDYVL